MFHFGKICSRKIQMSVKIKKTAIGHLKIGSDGMFSYSTLFILNNEKPVLIGKSQLPTGKQCDCFHVR